MLTCRYWGPAESRSSQENLIVQCTVLWGYWLLSGRRDRSEEITYFLKKKLNWHLIFIHQLPAMAKCWHTNSQLLSWGSLRNIIMRFSLQRLMYSCTPGRATRRWCHWHWSYVLDVQLHLLHGVRTEGCYGLQRGTHKDSIYIWYITTLLLKWRYLFVKGVNLWTLPSLRGSRSPLCAASPILWMGGLLTSSLFRIFCFLCWNFTHPPSFMDLFIIETLGDCGDIVGFTRLHWIRIEGGG